MSDDAPNPDADEAEPPEADARPRRKKKRAAEAQAAAPTEHEAGEPKAPIEHAVPAFARGFPRDPALDALVAAFEAGDFARVRREAPELAKQTDRDEVRAAARELMRRLDPDPLAVYLLGIAAVLLAFLAGWYWLHPHGG